jgi:hypothetical protein
MALSAVLAESRNAFEQVSQRAQDALKRAKPPRHRRRPDGKLRRLYSFLQRGSPAAQAKRKPALSLSRGQSRGGQARARAGAPAAPVTTVHGRRAARFLPLPECLLSDLLAPC